MLHAVAGRPMIEYPVALARALGSERVVCVLGHQADAVRAAVEARFGAGAVEVAIQAEQRGTGHAVLQAAPLLAAHDGLRAHPLRRHAAAHRRRRCARLVAGASADARWR